MVIPMDEIVEVATRAMWDHDWPDKPWESIPDDLADYYRSSTRAGLESVAPLIAAKALMDAVELMRRCKDSGHWNLRDPYDSEISYSPDVWLSVYADRTERGES